MTTKAQFERGDDETEAHFKDRVRQTAEEATARESAICAKLGGSTDRVA